MASKKTRSYNAFLREIKRSKGISHRQAQAAYRTLAEKLGAAPLKADIARHPRLTANAVKVAAKLAPVKPKPKAAPAKPVKAAPKGKTKPKAAPAKPIRMKPPAPPAGVQKVPNLDVWEQARPDIWINATQHLYHAGINYEYADKSKKTTRARGMRVAPRRHDLRIEFAVRVAHPNSVQLTPKFLNEAVAQWAFTGVSPLGVEVSQVSWTRDGRESRQARGADSIEDVRQRLISRLFGESTFVVKVEGKLGEGVG